MAKSTIAISTTDHVHRCPALTFLKSIQYLLDGTTSARAISNSYQLSVIESTLTSMSDEILELMSYPPEATRYVFNSSNMAHFSTS